MFSLIPWRNKEQNTGRSLAPRETHPLSQLRSEFDSLFNRFFGDWPMPFGDWPGMTGYDLEDAGKEWVVRAEAPGFEPEDFDVQLAGNLLTIRAERKQEAKEKQGEYRYAERRFERTVTLPAGAIPDQVTARYHSGVLELHLPKSLEAQAKRIEVKT